MARRTLSRGRRATGIAVAVAGSVLVLLLLPPGLPSIPRPLGASPSPGPTPFGSGPCGGPHVPSSFSGTLAVEGGASPPSVSNRTVRVLYAYQDDFTRSGGGTTTSCSTGSATATTGPTGGFSLTLSIPASGCSAGGCQNYSGPFGPTSFGVTGTIPAGYFVSSHVNGTTVALDFVLALESAGLSPFGRTTVSFGAPVVLTASGLAGDGTVSPATLSFAWTLSGTGWTVLSGLGTSQLSVVANPAAGSLTVNVYVNGTYNGTAQEAAPRSAVLTPVATVLVADSVSPTALDVGTPAKFSLTGTGSAGYTYVATVFPGLNLAPVSATCASSPQMGGLVSLACTVLVTYPSPGVAQPSANLTNGYSTADSLGLPFPQLTISPSLALVLTPSPARGYVGFPVSYLLSVGVATGTAPLGPACFWPGDGTFSCQGVGPTSWTFVASFGRTGSYSGVATVADAAGANRSTSVVTVVTNAPTLSSIASSTNKTSAGSLLPLTSSYAGGALPAAYWWNDSLPSTTLSRGMLGQDGPISLTYQPAVAGIHHVTLTVVDGLGTVKAVTLTVVVTAGPASSIVPVGGPGGWTTTAGTPYNVSWAVVSPAGDVVPGYACDLTLTPLTSARPLWLNLTGGAALTPQPSGAFLLSASDWKNGYLNFSLDAGTAGPLRVAVTSPLPISDVRNGTLTLSVGYDHLHLELRDPIAAPNATENRTLYTISDRFWNPLPTGYVVIVTNVSGTVTLVYSPVLFNGTVSVVWINFSLPTDVGGMVVVRSAWGQLLLPPLTVAAPVGASLGDLGLLVVLAALAAVCLAVGVRARRPTPATAPTPAAPSTMDPAEAEMRRLAAGREYVLSRSDPGVARELADLVRGFPGIPPTPTELAEWVGSLVNEGLLRASVGPDGKPRFIRRAGAVDPRPVDDTPPRVELDSAALEAALAERPEPESDPDREPGGDESAPPG